MKGLSSTKISALICTLGSILCLIFGFSLAGYWEIILLLPAIPLYWYFTRKVSTGLTISILLLVYVLLAAIGLLKDLSPYPMVIGCVLALAGWESAQFLLNFHDTSMDLTNPRLEYLHNKDLVIAIGFGLLLALLGLNIRLHLPFGLVAGLVLLAAFGLYRGLRVRKIG